MNCQNAKLNSNVRYLERLKNLNVNQIVQGVQPQFRPVFRGMVHPAEPPGKNPKHTSATR